MPTRQDQRLLAQLNRAPVSGEGGPFLTCLVLLRVFVGFKFLQLGIGKLPNLGNPGVMQGMITEWAGYAAHPFWGYQEFLKQVVLPNIAVFNLLVIFGEIAVGSALLLGMATRLAAFFALFMNVNYWFAGGYRSPAAAGFNEALALIDLVLILTGAGRLLGFDAWLARRFPRVPFW